MAPKITDLKPQKKNKNRISVFLDGEFAFGLSRIVATWLRVDQELTPEKIIDLREQDAREVAMQRAIKFLSYRPRSSAEVRENLAKHEIPSHTIDSVLDRLHQNGMVDDRAFARAWIENREEFRPRGARALRMELRQKGLDEDLISEVLESIDEVELAYKAASPKAPRYQGLDEWDFKKKLGGFLSRRGFDYSTITETTQQIWEELNQLKTKEETK